MFTSAAAARTVLYTVALGCDLTQISDAAGRDSTSGNVLGDPVPKHRNAVRGERQVEAADHRAIVGDEQIVGTDA